MMTGQTGSEPKANPMADTWTTAGKIRRKYKVGNRRMKNRVLHPLAAIGEGCQVLDAIRKDMHDEGTF